MHNRDLVLRAAARAAENHAGSVRSALSVLLSAETEFDRVLGEARLRDTLVLLDAGHETTAGNGSTCAARKRAAREALEAWDGTACGELPAGRPSYEPQIDRFGKILGDAD